jgi:hypothetical protein
MPITFHDRERAFEAKFAHDEELRFRVAARRDKLFARWVATTLRLPSDGRDALVERILAIPNGPAHDKTLLEFAANFVSARGISRSEAGLVTALDRCAQQALKDLPKRIRRFRRGWDAWLG